MTCRIEFSSHYIGLHYTTLATKRHRIIGGMATGHITSLPPMDQWLFAIPHTPGAIRGAKKSRDAMVALGRYRLGTAYHNYRTEPM